MASAVSNAIAAIYGCATEPSRWPIALQDIADCFGDVGALLLHQRSDGSLATLATASLEPCLESYQREWWRHDIRAERALGYLYEEVGAAITDRHVVSDEEIATHPVYTQFLAPFGLRWTASVQVSPKVDVQVGLSVLRSAARPPFDDDELALLTDLGRHAEQSLRLGVRLIEAEAVNVGLADALSRLSVGAFVVDGETRILFANAKADALVGRAFAVNGNRLTCPGSTDGKRLAALLSSSAEAAHRGGLPVAPSSPLVVHQGARRWAIYVVPIVDRGADAGLAAWISPPSTDTRTRREARATDMSRCRTLVSPGALSIVLAVDLAPGAPLDPGLVRDVYGLTLGESRVAALVGAGVSPRETAQRLNIAEETVRCVLKRVFNKLDVARQGELVELFSRLKAATLAAL